VKVARLLIIFFAALVLSACQVDVVVDVDVTEDGSGTVTLMAAFDDEIDDAAPELLDGLRTEDLLPAGWIVDGPRRTEGGGAVVVSATKPFASPDDLGGVLDEIAGPGTLFSDFAVERTRSFARTTYDVTGKINPRISFTTFGDDNISGLVGAPLGLSLAELQAAAGRPLEETVTLRFSITLPDTVVANTADVDGRVANWQLSPRDPLATDIDVSSSIEDRLPRIWAAVALVALALLGTLLIFRILARFGGRRTDDLGEEVVQMRRPDKAPSEAAAVTAPRERPPRLELVVLDARGVLYDEANDIGARLVPFVRERGSKASLQEINDAFRSASLGRLSTAELWTNLGLTDDPAELDALYTAEFRLREGVLDFIDRLHERGLRVAVITNNVLGWSKAIRKRFDLDERVDIWVVSGEIGSRKPDAAFFEALRRMTSVEYTDSLLIDDQIDDLDMARSLNMSTAMFVPNGAQLPASSPHPIVHGFDSFFGRS
jgi:HAD superfamily hydrolase (TIGR01509 family)